MMSSNMKTCIYSLRFVENKTELVIALSVLAATGLTVKLCRKLFARYRLSSKRATRQKKRTEELQTLKKQLLNVSTELVNEICKLKAEEIIKSIKEGRYTPAQVLQAFQCKALEAHERTNSVVGFIHDASTEAENLGNEAKEKLLYGLPVSVKENYCLTGYDSTIGCARLLDLDLDNEDAVLVQVLRHQGAIPFVRTNVPQTMLSWHTSNPIYGRTRNPHDEGRTVGGSSGGEAALLAAGGSVLGWGSDIGGSLRIPANMCGVFALKPTAGRISCRGTTPLMPGQTLVKSVFGPMSRDVESLVLGMRAVLVPRMWELDPVVVPMPFNDQLFEDKRRLRIGYFVSDDYLRAVPASQRAVREAVRHLEALGHTVAEWRLPADYYRTVSITWLAAIMGDTGRSVRDLMQDDRIDDAMTSLVPLLYLPRPVKKALAVVVRPLGTFLSKISMVLTASCGPDDVYGWWKLAEKIEALRAQALEEWNANGFDAVICPGFACPAPPKTTPAKCPGAASYTAMWNTLDFPAGSMPVTTVSARDVTEGKDYPACDLWHSALKKSIEGSVGLPVNVQVVCRPWQDEQVLRIMKELQGAESKQTQGH